MISTGLINLHNFEVNKVVLHDPIRGEVRLFQKPFAVFCQFGVGMPGFTQSRDKFAGFCDQLLQFGKGQGFRRYR